MIGKAASSVPIIAGSFWPRRMRALSARRPRVIFMSIECRAIIFGEVLIQFTKSEFAILLALAVRRGGIISLDDLVEILYGDNSDGGPDWPNRVVGVFISKMRMKLEVFPFVAVRTVWGRGWYLDLSEPRCLREAAE